MKLSLQVEKLTKGLVGLTEMSVAVRHKFDKGFEVSELRQRPSNGGQGYLIHQSLHTIPSALSRRQDTR